VISSRNQRAVDDPRPASVPDHRAIEQRGEPRSQVCDDAMRLGLGDREHGSELAYGQVRPEREACNEHPSFERLRPTMTSAVFRRSQ
jgi:hypothetical protein